VVKRKANATHFVPVAHAQLRHSPQVGGREAKRQIVKM